MHIPKEAFLGGYILTALWLCLGVTLYGTANQQAPHPMDIISGVTMEIDNAEVASPHLRVKVCGPDMTQLPASGFPLRFGFDTAVRRVTGADGHTSLTIRTQVTGQTATVALARDPFMPPTPWHVTLRIDLARVPGVGFLTLGTLPVQNMPAGFAATAGHPMVIYGTGCDDLRATLASPQALRHVALVE